VVGVQIHCPQPLTLNKGGFMSDKKIVVLHRGWVVVGDVRKEGNEIVVENASVIRRWGTTKGLGQLASDGPQSNTVLDAAGTVRANELAVVLTLDCNAEKWA
jgi:hypothetical protein